MNISRSKLYQIILEEYAMEEGILLEAMSQEKADEFIAWIKGTGPKPEWLEREYGPGSYKRGKQTPAYDSNVDRSAETMPIGMDDEPVDEKPPGDSLVDQIAMLVKGMDAEDVSDLFQAVFMKIPGVEIGPPEEEPETLYRPGAEGRPQAGFKLEELKKLIREVLEEGHYHDMGGEEEMYNVLDPHNFEKMSDDELVDMMHRDGMEELIVLDGDGDLVNRDVVIKALKDV